MKNQRIPFFLLLGQNDLVCTHSGNKHTSSGPSDSPLIPLSVDWPGAVELLLEQLIDLMLFISQQFQNELTVTSETNKEPVFLDLEGPNELGNSRVKWTSPVPRQTLDLTAWGEFLEDVLSEAISLREDILAGHKPNPPPNLNTETIDYEICLSAFESAYDVLKDRFYELINVNKNLMSENRRRGDSIDCVEHVLKTEKARVNLYQKVIEEQNRLLACLHNRIYVHHKEITTKIRALYSATTHISSVRKMHRLISTMKVEKAFLRNLLSFFEEYPKEG